ncbi:germination protein M [Gracilibacillus ureilyticus]|uniref:Germination protein M n=1 Tax=Gracilibacillus ureilyticus TaxID=531814 RepID=A0A1H9RS41_9BACI|nr:GerMN domain-containing protein [Gracilibacillus ureilyticus]SER75526.1 germination protein M [Gracilibacillus ureilyticus]
MKIDFTKKTIGILSASMFLLAGCGVFQGEQTLEQLDAPPEETNLTEDLENISDQLTETEGEEEIEDGTEEGGTEGGEEGDGSDGEDPANTSETVSRVLYLLDENGLVVPQEVELPSPTSKEVAKQVLEYLVKDGPVTGMLPTGFEAVLPAGTEIIDLNLEPNGTLVVNVSEDFQSYQPEEEQQILEAMTYTLTQFENVERIKLWINGVEQNEMPVNGTPVSQGYSRENGINVHQSEGIDLMESEATTLYFPMQSADESIYYVPITQHIENNTDSEYESIVQALLSGPSFDLPLQNYINTGSQLAAAPIIQDGILSLTFNENILSNSEKSMLADEVMQSLVLTLTEQEGIDAVEVSVENHEQVVNESGQPYTEPVSKDMVVPTDSI